MKSYSLYLWVMMFGSIAFSQEDAGERRVILSPGTMGPNGVPVQKVRETRVPNFTDLKLGVANHVDPGAEYAMNPILELLLPYGRYVALRLFTHPIEYFKTTEEVRKLRNARLQEGMTKGDLYFGTAFQLALQEKTGFDLMLNATTKTTTGKDAESARHTNSPGYIIDGTWGKTYPLLGYFKVIQFSGYVSFIAWQSGVSEQNDAAGYGIRSDLIRESYRIALEFGSYYGWQRKLDMPAVYRMHFILPFDSWDLFLSYTRGVRDSFPNTMITGVSIHFDPPQLESLIGLPSAVVPKGSL